MVIKAVWLWTIQLFRKKNFPETRKAGRHVWRVRKVVLRSSGIGITKHHFMIYSIHGDTIWHSTYSGEIPQGLFWQGLERYGSCTWNESEQISFLWEFSSREAAKVLGLESPHQLQLRRVRTEYWYIWWYMVHVSLKEDWNSWTCFHFEYLWTHIVQANFWSRNSWNGCWHTIHLCLLRNIFTLGLLC